MAQRTALLLRLKKPTNSETKPAIQTLGNGWIMPLHSQYQFLAAVAMATSGIEAEFYSKIVSPPTETSSSNMTITEMLQKKADRGDVTVITNQGAFLPKSGISRATIKFDNNIWQAIPVKPKGHLNISETLDALDDLHETYNMPLYHLVSRFPDKVRVGLFGGVGEGKSTLVESVFGKGVSTRSDESGSQTSWIHEFNFTDDDEYRVSATFVSADELERLREECEDELILHNKLKLTKKEVKSYFGNDLVEAIEVDHSHAMYITRPSAVDNLEEKYSDCVVANSFEEYQFFIQELQEYRHFVQAVYSDIPLGHPECLQIPDLTIIDLPGSNDTNTNRARMIEKIIGEVDVIIFVSNQRNNTTTGIIDKKLFKYGLDSMKSKRSARILNIATFGDMLVKDGKSYDQAWSEAYRKFQTEGNAPKDIRSMPYLLTGHGLKEGAERFARFLREVVAVKAKELEAVVLSIIQVLNQSRIKNANLMREIKLFFTETIPKELAKCDTNEWMKYCLDLWFDQKIFGGCGGYQVLGATIRRSGQFSSTKRGYINVLRDIVTPLAQYIADIPIPENLAEIQFVELAKLEVIRQLEVAVGRLAAIKFFPELIVGGGGVKAVLNDINLSKMYKNLFAEVTNECTRQSDEIVKNLKNGDKEELDEKIAELKKLISN